MRRKLRTLLIVSAVIQLFLGANLAGKEIALTFEKLPYMEPLGFWTPREISNQVLRTLAQHSIESVGFVVEEKIDLDPSTYVVLTDWVEKGQRLGNSTYAYVDLNELPVRDFLGHIADGGKYIRKATWVARQPLYFRYPMLHEGDTESKKTQVARRLRDAGFVLVPATVFVTDYEFNHLYADQQRQDELDRLQSLFLDLILSTVEYAEQQSQAVFGREIPQILNLHLGVATAQYLDPLLNALTERGYTFITVDKALADEAYESDELYLGGASLGFIDRVAATRELPFDENRGRLLRREIARRLSASE
jgi:peptidoglycan/xylan/chitin deacetylase (PgdA/CDA1 family)